jgi:hypothetical protein
MREDATMFRKLRASLAAFAILVTAPGLALAQSHVALVIDNHPGTATAALSVTTDAGATPAAAPTAATIAQQLTRMAYSVTHVERLDALAMRAQLEQFRASAEKAEVAIVYFHGHVVDVKGRNHLLADKVAPGATLDAASLPLDDIVERMKATRANIVLVDPATTTPSRSGSREWATPCNPARPPWPSGRASSS